MANTVRNSFKQQLGEEKHNLTADSIRVVLIDLADYTFSSAHDFLDDIPGAARVAVSGGLTSPTNTSGVFDTADFSFTSVTGDQSEALELYNHDGNAAGADSARQLMVFYDTGMTGMPVTPNGGNINVTVNGSGWYAL